MDDKAVLLCRLALFKEVAKVPLKREEILGIVDGRNLYSLIDHTNNTIMQPIFGMKIVELPFKASSSSSTETNSGRKAMLDQNSRQKENFKTGNFTLISTLKERIKVKSGMLGFLTLVILAISIQFSGEIEADELKSFVERYTEFSWNDPHPTLENSSPSDLLNHTFKKQKYIIVTKRVDDSPVVVYSLGPRALIEFPHDSLSKILFEIGQSVNDTSITMEKCTKSINVK